MNELGNTPADKNYKPSGISRAEQRALEAYPHDMVEQIEEPGFLVKTDYNRFNRAIFTRGYEQAEKDTTERAISWLKEHADDYIVDLTPSYPDAPVNIIVGGMCWEHLKNFLEND